MKNSGNGSRIAPGDIIRPTATALIMAAISIVVILADHALTVEMLVILVGVALAIACGRHRRSANQRRSAHARSRRPQPLHADDYPSWPGRPGPYALHPDHPSWPGRPDPRWVSTESALRADGYPGWPGPPSPPWRDAEPPWAVTAPSPGPMRQEHPGGVIDRVRSERGQVWDAGSVELATWIISEANQQAADIRHEARDQMAAMLADAKQEAAELVAKASEQATATLTAAELEAAEIRATVTKLSADLGGVAARITENLVGLAPPATKPLTRPAA